MAIIYFILILGITVFIHEFGHFIFAKKFGVYVYEFSIGMGPRLFKWKRKNDETEYCIRLLPIGGFVQMAGEEVEVDENIPEEKRLQSKKPYQRLLIMVAGVMMNFLLAIVLLFVIGLFNPVSLNNVHIDNSTIDGLSNGDKIVKIDNRFVNNYDKLALELAVTEAKPFTMTVEDKNGKEKDIKVNPKKIGNDNLLLGYDYGFSVSDLSITKSKIKGISKDDEIVMINDKEVKNYLELLNILDENKNKEFTLLLKDAKDNYKEFTITPEKKKEDMQGYSYGFYITGDKKQGLLPAIKYAFFKFFTTIEQMIFTVVYLITGRLSLKALSGPVGIYSVVDAYSKLGISNLISLLCLICINVGFINILPFPAFDGGHVLFIIIEKIKGSPVNPKVENTIHNIGFILLMILMVLVTYNDIIRLFF